LFFGDSDWPESAHNVATGFFFGDLPAELAYNSATDFSLAADRPEPAHDAAAESVRRWRRRREVERRAERSRDGW
jgi:hypothetical protein